MSALSAYKAGIRDALGFKGYAHIPADPKEGAQYRRGYVTGRRMRRDETLLDSRPQVTTADLVARVDRLATLAKKAGTPDYADAIRGRWRV